MLNDMKKFGVYIFALFAVFGSCKKNQPENPDIPEEQFYIKAVDISAFPEIDQTNPVFYNAYGIEEDFLDILKNAGVNTIRLKLWVNPKNVHSGFSEVKTFSEMLRSKGFKIWLAPHYSDTWADPGHQETPDVWKNLSFTDLMDTVYAYTSRVVKQMNPDYIQIGNEINSGFLFPSGNLDSNPAQFRDLLFNAVKAVRNNSELAKIIIHFAGINNADWFFSQLNNPDYDIIGLSFYPIWHGKSLTNLQNTVENLSEKHDKNVIVAETAYPFTLDWNDWTNNIVGLPDQLILPDYPATEQGQHDFLNEIKKITSDIEYGSGFCYWGAELIAWKGQESTSGSVWENQALFDFQNKALPVLDVFKDIQ